ncbi:expressed unknown protein [Ectocarpus siliculosus]|uniref:Uncharacterized protein n=1 Tax=Ectocarpus siliculosus TaxID=2880 RepID=D7G3U5_ECTSI|nr:expressed unknown protein [Ectocarpus siliculosus]|eukprot:CBJ33622.1 expressed unknown protein [Ectocarpus siliculosus]
MMRMSSTAFQRLVSIQESSPSDASIDVGSFTWLMLSDTAFTPWVLEDAPGNEQTQALMLEHIARIVDKYSHKQPGGLEGSVRPHMRQQDDLAADLDEKLPGDKVPEDQRRIIVAKPMNRVLKVAKQDPGMKKLYEKNEERLQGVLLSQNFAELVPEPEASADDRGGCEGSGDDDDNGGCGESGNDDDNGGCDFMEAGDGGGGDYEEDDEEDHRTTSQSKTKKDKGKKGKGEGKVMGRGKAKVMGDPVTGSTPAVPGGKKSRQRKCKRNSVGKLLTARPTTQDDDERFAECMEDKLVIHKEYDVFRRSRSQLDELEPRNTSKLVVFNLAAFPGLLKQTKITDQQLVDVFYTIRHDFLHGLGTMAPLVPPPWVVHRGRLYDDLFGNNQTASPPSSTSILTDVPYEGADVDWPSKVLLLLTNRYTNQGDTIIVLGAERNACVATGLARGRRVEAYVTSETHVEHVQEWGETAFRTAYTRGIFQPEVVVPTEVEIKPGRLPRGLPLDTTPPKETQFDDRALYTAPGVNYTPGTFDLLIWGCLHVYDSRRDAYLSLDEDAHDKRYVRLIRAASNAQLRACCTPGEACLTSSTAQLFLQVAPTCLMYWARWSTDRRETRMDIRSALPLSSDKEAMIGRWQPPTPATSATADMGCALVGYNFRSYKAGSSDVMKTILVTADDMVVAGGTGPTSTLGGAAATSKKKAKTPGASGDDAGDDSEDDDEIVNEGAGEGYLGRSYEDEEEEADESAGNEEESAEEEIKTKVAESRTTQGGNRITRSAAPAAAAYAAAADAADADDEDEVNGQEEEDDDEEERITTRPDRCRPVRRTGGRRNSGPPPPPPPHPMTTRTRTMLTRPSRN